jgi:molecular chaperone GrpE
MADEDVVFEFEEEGNAGVKKLREKLASCQKEKEEYLAGWQRAKADLINANRRASEDISHARERAHEEMTTDLMTVVDSFSMAFANREAWEKVDAKWRSGVEYIAQSLLKVLGEYGLEEMVVQEGDHFSPELHHSVEVVKTGDKKQDDTIARVIQKGYTYNGRAFRPATVAVYRFEE